MIDHIWLVLLMPLLGVIINLFFGEKIGKKGVSLVGCGSVGLAFLFSSLIFYSMVLLPDAARSSHLLLYTWIKSASFRADAGFLLDPLSGVMIMIVSGVGFFIHVYSVGYMSGDPGYRRYFVYLNLFVFSMLLLVLADNFLLLFVGWEAVGLCSYLLIGFWYERKAAADAGKKAFIVNRVGDFGFALGILLIFTTFGRLDYAGIFGSAAELVRAGQVESWKIALITFLLLAGATGKSAQIPLFTWLPDAMEGPTPVSALIHAATMVTAGVYMVARTSALYLLSPEAMTLVATIGGATAFMAASIALAQNDIKRVLAYSTISQIGYMVLGAGVGAFASGIFHLMSHAFFKALLFLGAGSVMHALAGETDIRKMGGLAPRMKITATTFWIGAFALAGVFPFSGFFSKDEILWAAYNKSFFYWVLGASAAFMTAVYIFRVVFLAFHGKPRMEPELARHAHESPPVMTFPLIVLAALSAVGGLAGLPLIEGGNRIGEFLAPALGEATAHGAQGSKSLEAVMMALSLAIAVVGILFARSIYIARRPAPEELASLSPPIYKLLFNKYYVDEIYDSILVSPAKRAALFLWGIFDIRVVDGMANGLGSFVNGWGSAMRMLQSGYVKSYALSMVFGAALIALYYVLR